MGFVLGRKPEHESLHFFRVKWLQPAMVPCVCGGCGCGRFCREFVPPLCSATVVVSVCVVLCVSWICGCRSQWRGRMIVVIWCCHVRREMRVGHVMLQKALQCLQWLHECSMGFVLGRKPEHESLHFFRVKWLQPAMVPRVCGGCGCGRFCREFVPPQCSATVVVSVCVVLCVSWICGCRSQWRGRMIVVIWCCHVRREMRVSHVMLQNALQWLQWLHECSMGFVLGRKSEHESLHFFRVKWLQPAIVPRVCGGCGCGRFCRECVPSLCSATSGRSCVCRSIRFLNLRL